MLTPISPNVKVNKVFMTKIWCS